MTDEEVESKQAQAQLDPEFFSLLSMIPLGGDKMWIRGDLWEDKLAFQAFIEHMTPYDTWELLLEMAYLGVKTGNVIIRGIRTADTTADFEGEVRGSG